MLEQEKEWVRKALHDLPSLEQELLKREWAGINSGSIISTPIYLLFEMAKKIGFQSGEVLVDIGSGHGDPALVFGTLHPGLKVIGYDIAQPKVESANRLAQNFDLQNVKFFKQDLGDPAFNLPVADYYYLFNPASSVIVARMAAQIRQIAKTKAVKVIVFSGGWTPDIFNEFGFIKTKSLGWHTTVFEYNGRVEKWKSPFNELIQEHLDMQRDKPNRWDHFRLRNQELDSEAARELFDLQDKRNYQSILEAFRTIPIGQRLDYLRSLSSAELVDLSRQIDLEYFFGIEGTRLEASHKITSWPHTINTLASMNPKAGDVVMEVGLSAEAGAGRLGLLLGLLRPEVQFIGRATQGGVSELVQAARENGFDNLHFTATGLGTSMAADTLLADHIHLVRLDSRQVEVVLRNLINLPPDKDFKIYTHDWFESLLLHDYFKRTGSETSLKQIYIWRRKSHEKREIPLAELLELRLSIKQEYELLRDIGARLNPPQIYPAKPPRDLLDDVDRAIMDTSWHHRELFLESLPRADERRYREVLESVRAEAAAE